MMQNSLGRVAAALIAGLLVVLVLDILFRSSLSEVEATVIGKRESIQMLGEDRWRRLFEVTYRFEPKGASVPRIESHPVDAALYSRVKRDDDVKVRYTSWPWLLPMQGVGSAIVGSSWRSRFPGDSSTERELGELGIIVVTVALAILALRTKNRVIGWSAGLMSAVTLSSIVLAAWLVFPLLALLWRQNLRKGFGWLFLAAATLSVAVLDWRIPSPATLNNIPMEPAIARVRQVQVARSIWFSHWDGGLPLRLPFDIVDLEFKPNRSLEPVHMVDRIDIDSVPSLQPGAIAAIQYSTQNPRIGRLTTASRRFARDVFSYIGETYATIAAVVVVSVWLAHAAIAKMFAAFPILRVFTRFNQRSSSGARAAGFRQDEAARPEHRRIPPERPDLDVD